MIAEYDEDAATGAETIVRRYIYGPGVDEPIAMVDYTDPDSTGDLDVHVYYHQDRRGSVIALSDEAGVVASTNIFTYDSHGVPNEWGGNRIRFTGRWMDADTGLYYYRARFYSPTLGRFLQTDPIGYGDNMNMYAYVNGDPMNATDPSGEFAWLVPMAIGAAIGGGFEYLSQVAENVIESGDIDFDTSSIGAILNSSLEVVSELGGQIADLDGSSFRPNDTRAIAESAAAGMVGGPIGKGVAVVARRVGQSRLRRAMSRLPPGEQNLMEEVFGELSRSSVDEGAVVLGVIGGVLINRTEAAAEVKETIGTAIVDALSDNEQSDPVPSCESSNNEAAC